MSGIVGGAGSKSGVIKRPSSFQARGEAGWAAISQYDIVPFDDVSTGDCFDVGGDYNTTDKKYTAPFAGRYWFFFNCYTAQNDTNNGFTFKKNGTLVNLNDSSSNELSFGPEGDSGDIIQHGGVPMTLAGGDYIQVCTAHASDFHGSYSAWGGFYIMEA
mgnify:FL=1